MYKFDGDYEQMNKEDYHSFDELFDDYHDSRTIETYDIVYHNGGNIRPDLIKIIIHYALYYNQGVFIIQDNGIEYARIVICKDVLAMAYSDFLGYYVSSRGET